MDGFRVSESSFSSWCRTTAGKTTTNSLIWCPECSLKQSFPLLSIIWLSPERKRTHSLSTLSSVNQRTRFLLSSSFIPIPSRLARPLFQPLSERDQREPSCSQSRAASFISHQWADPGRAARGSGRREGSTRAAGGTRFPAVSPPGLSGNASRGETTQLTKETEARLTADGQTGELLNAFVLAEDRRLSACSTSDCFTGGAGVWRDEGPALPTLPCFSEPAPVMETAATGSAPTAVETKPLRTSGSHESEAASALATTWKLHLWKYKRGGFGASA